jgi:hypothetical protein
VNVSGGSTFTMQESATVSGNKTADPLLNSTADMGGGIFIVGASPDYSTFNMLGGTISGNESGSGGGLYVGADSVFTMSGGKVSTNTADAGGGVYVANSTGTFKMDGTGVEVSGNTATGLGGGVFVAAGTFDILEGTVYGENEEEDRRNIANSVITSKGSALHVLLSGTASFNGIDFITLGYTAPYGIDDTITEDGIVP